MAQLNLPNFYFCSLFSKKQPLYLEKESSDLIVGTSLITTEAVIPAKYYFRKLMLK